MADSSQVSERRVGGVTILDLQEQTMLEEGVSIFREAVDRLVEQGRLQVIVNLQEVAHIDSAGIGMLAGKYLSLRRRGGDLKLLHVTSRTHRVMTITRLLTVFAVFESEHEAVKSFDVDPATAIDSAS